MLGYGGLGRGVGVVNGWVIGGEQPFVHFEKSGVLGQGVIEFLGFLQTQGYLFEDSIGLFQGPISFSFSFRGSSWL